MIGNWVIAACMSQGLEPDETDTVFTILAMELESRLASENQIRVRAAIDEVKSLRVPDDQ